MVEPAELQMLVEYELVSSWIAWRIKYKPLQRLIAAYYRYKVACKYSKYLELQCIKSTECAIAGVVECSIELEQEYQKRVG